MKYIPASPKWMMELRVFKLSTYSSAFCLSLTNPVLLGFQLISSENFLLIHKSLTWWITVLQTLSCDSHYSDMLKVPLLRDPIPWGSHGKGLWVFHATDCLPYVHALSIPAAQTFWSLAHHLSQNEQHGCGAHHPSWAAAVLISTLESLCFRFCLPHWILRS